MDISPTLEDREILYRLVENVDVREFPDTFNTRAFSSDTESLWSTRIETNSAYSFELDGTSLIPFDQDTVNKVSWESTTNGKMHIGMRAIAVSHSHTIDLTSQWCDLIRVDYHSI